MDTQKLLHEQKMMADAVAAGFCTPPRQNRKFLFDGLPNGRGKEFKGFGHKKLLDEQQALEQAEAVGFCVPRRSPEFSHKHTESLPPEWNTHVRRDSYGSNNRRTTATDYWRGSGDATAGRSTTTVSRSNDDDEDEEEELCHRDLSDESIPLLQAPLGPRLSKNTVRETITSQPSTVGQTVQRSASVNTCRTGILSRVSTRVTDKPPSVPGTEPSSKTNQDELGGETWSPWALTLALIYGLVLLVLAELYFHASGQRNQPSARARSSLLRLIIDDFIYYVMRHFT